MFSLLLKDLNFYYYLSAKRNSGELRCPATALIFFALKHRSWVLVRTASLRRFWGGSYVYPSSMFWARMRKTSHFFIWKLPYLQRWTIIQIWTFQLVYMKWYAPENINIDIFRCISLHVHQLKSPYLFYYITLSVTRAFLLIFCVKLGENSVEPLLGKVLEILRDFFFCLRLALKTLTAWSVAFAFVVRIPLHTIYWKFSVESGKPIAA